MEISRRLRSRRQHPFWSRDVFLFFSLSPPHHRKRLSVVEADRGLFCTRLAWSGLVQANDWGWKGERGSERGGKVEVQGCRRRWSSGRCLHKHQRRHCAAWNVEQRAACILMLNLAFSSWQHRTVDLWSRPASGHGEPLHGKQLSPRLPPVGECQRYCF